MGRGKKRQKTEEADTVEKTEKGERNEQGSSSDMVREGNEGDDQQEVSDTRMCETDNTNCQEPIDGVEQHRSDDLDSTLPNDRMECSEYVVDEADLPNRNRNEEGVSGDNVECDSPEKEGDQDKSTIAQLTSDGFLACLLTCGSQRLNETLYSVVRNLLNSKTCSVCDTPIAGASLPGLTYLKTRLKPSVRSLVAKYEIVELSVDRQRSGAKLGIDKYKSGISAPVLVVKPSECARIDFSTPAVRKLIWENVTDNKNVFKSIEHTPIVRHRKIFPADNIAKDKNGIEHVVVKGDRLQLTLIRNAKIDNVLKRYFGDGVIFKEVDGVASAFFECTVLDYEYVSNDRDGHHIVDGKVFERHNACCEKAGGVIFYLKTCFGNARLVNRHNCEEGEEACTLEMCHGERTECRNRSFPVNDLIVIHKSRDIEEDNVPNSGRLEDGTRYFVYRVLLYTDGFNAYRSRIGTKDGMYMIPLGIPLDLRTEAGCLHKICLAPPGISATDLMEVLIADIIEGMTKGVEVEDHLGKARLFIDVLCYIDDSPALASATGTKGHSADCPCHACVFRKDKARILAIVRSKGETSSSSYAKRTYRTVRDIENQNNNSKEVLDNIGVSNSDAPLMKLADALKGL